MIGTAFEASARRWNAMLTSYRGAAAAIKDQDVRARNLKVIDDLASALEGMAKQEDQIALNRDLSAEGQAKLRSALGKATLLEISFVETRAANLDAAYRDLKGRLLPALKPASGQEAILEAIRGGEIRTQLRSLTKGEQMTQYSLAVQNDNTEVVRAFRFAPLPLTITPEEMDAIDEQRVAVHRAEEMARLEMLDVARQQLHDLADALKAWLEGYARMTVPAAKTPAIPKRDELAGTNLWQPPAKGSADRPTEKQFT
jgi:hypothetical protein